MLELQWNPLHHFYDYYSKETFFCNLEAYKTEIEFHSKEDLEKMYTRKLDCMLCEEEVPFVFQSMQYNLKTLHITKLAIS